MKLKITTVLCCLFPIIAFSQFTGKWDQTISSDYDVLVDVGYDNSQNVYLLGKKANTDDDIVLVKYNSSGKVWVRTFDSGDDDEPKRLQVDDSGNSYIVGTALEGDKTECLAIKYNSSGTKQWDDIYSYTSSTSSAYSGSYNDAVLYSGTLYVVGNQYSGALYNQDLVVAKYTSGGSRTLRLNTDDYFEYGKKLKVVGSTIHIAAIETYNDNLIYYTFSTGFNSSSTPSSETSTSCTWSDFVDFDVSGSNAAFVNDLGSTTGIITYNGSSFYSTTSSNIYDVEDIMIDGTKVIMTGREWVSSSYRLCIAAHNITGASQSFWTDMEPKPGNDDHQAFSSGGIHLFENSSGEYVVAGNLVADDDPNDGNPAINPYVGFVRFNSSGVQQGFSLYETGGSITHAFEDSNNQDVVLISSKIYNLCDPPTPNTLADTYSEDYDPAGNSILLDAGSSFSSYDWSTGETTQTISVSSGGTYTVTVENATGCPAEDQIVVTLDPIDQTITFGSLSDKTYGDANFDLTASASSDLTVSFTSLDTDVATISGNTVTIVAPGEVTIRASQSGNDNYNAAPNVERTFNVNYLKYYWVGNGGAFDDNANHWATTSGGSSMHTSAPDENCDVIFDSNSFSTPGEEVTGSSLSCHDLDATQATNSPIFKMVNLQVYGSFWTNTSVTNQMGSTSFVSNESEEVGIQGAVNSTGNWQFGSPTGNGSWTITESFEIDLSQFNIYFGTVTVDNGTTLTIISSPIRHMNSSILVNNGSIVFGSASNFYSTSSVALSGTGTMTFKRNAYHEGAGKYSIFGSPITNGSTSSLGNLTYKYDESQDFGSDDGLSRFIQVTTPETMTPGTGYFSANINEVVFTGTPNSGTIDVPLDFNTSTGDEANYDGFNLVSNPYPAGLNFVDLLTANGMTGSGAIEDAIYVWVDGGSDSERRTSADYMILNELGQVSGNTAREGGVSNQDMLGSFQGFFVKATGTGQTLSFTEDMRNEYGSWDNNFFRTENTQSEDKHKTVKLSIENSMFYGETLLGFVEDASIEVKDRYDAQKLFGQHEFNVFSLSDNKEMAIQGLPLLQDEAISIPIGMEVSEAGSYHLRVKRSSIWDDSEFIYLFDAKSQDYSLIEDEEIIVNLEKGYNTSRFQLIVTRSGPINVEASLLNYLLEMGDHHLNVTGKLHDDNLNLEVFDLSGKIVWQEIVKSNANIIRSEFRIPDNSIYIIRISDPNYAISLKTIKQ